MKDSEGVAFYMTVKDQDGSETTMDLRKCKAADYTLMRKVREHVVSGHLFGDKGIAEKLKASLQGFDEDQKSIIEEVLKQKTPDYVALVEFFKGLPEQYTQNGAKKGKSRKNFTSSAQQAFRSQWVSIEEQFKNNALDRVIITIDGREFAFVKPKTSDQSQSDA